MKAIFNKHSIDRSRLLISPTADCLQGVTRKNLLISADQNLHMYIYFIYE